MLLDELALRTVVATASEVAKFGNIGKKSCIVTVENDLDQQVGIIVGIPRVPIRTSLQEQTETGQLSMHLGARFVCR
jgi:hypothetical protein